MLVTVCDVICDTGSTMQLLYMYISKFSPCYVAKVMKVCGPKTITLLDWTHLFEWYMPRPVVENEHNMPCVA